MRHSIWTRATAPLYSVRRVETQRDWLALRDRWDDLNTHSGHPSAFRTFDWTYHWWQVFLGAEMDRMRLFVLEDARGELVAVFPLHRVDCGPSSEWRMVGDLPGHHAVTEEPTVLARRDAYCVVVAEMFGFLGDLSRTDWDRCRFEIPVYSPRMARTDLAVRGGHLVCRRAVTLAGSALVDLPDTWEVFRAGLSRSMRDNLSYYPRRLNKDGHDWAVRFLDSPCEVRDAVPVLTELHRARAWDASRCPHTNHLPTDDYVRFLTRVLSRYAERGAAFIATLDIGGKPIAAQAFFQVGEVLTFYYSGYRTEWNAYSPLFIIAAEAIRRSLARGARRVNFLPDASSWKSRWGALPEGHRHRLRATRLSPGALFQRAGAALGNGL